jgi:hypothetical protein
MGHLKLLVTLINVTVFYTLTAVNNALSEVLNCAVFHVNGKIGNFLHIGNGDGQFLKI